MLRTYYVTSIFTVKVYAESSTDAEASMKPLIPTQDELSEHGEVIRTHVGIEFVEEAEDA